MESRPISRSWTLGQREEALKILAEEKESMTEAEYGQEFLCIPASDFKQFIPDELIQKICTGERLKTVPDWKMYSGHDIARMGGDEITHEVFGDTGNKIIQVENMVKKKQLTPEIERDIIMLAEIWKLRKIGLDAGSGTLGVSVLDHLMETHVRHKLVAMNNRSITLDNEEMEKQKLAGEDMYFNMKSMMEHEETIFLNDDNLKNSLRSLQMEYIKTPSGQTRVKIHGRYSHIAEGIKRALWLAKKEKSLNLFAY
jgi:hypothetical protein